MAMKTETSSSLDELIRQEERKLADDMFLETWEAALAHGLKPEIAARALVEGALVHLAGEAGEKTAIDLIRHIRSLDAEGAFLPALTLQ